MPLRMAAHATATVHAYRPRAPEHTVLHGIVREHLATFLRRASERDERGVPAFVEQEFRDFVTCGSWARGFARFQCGDCHAERLVPFSCKGRGFCPSCGGRRMAERAANLVDHVLPAVPVRQWVLSLPLRLRYLLLWDHGLCRAVLAIYARALLGFERRRARRRGVVDGRTGAVTAIQRFGSALNANVHFHTLVLDGVFTAAGKDDVRFDPAPPPTDREVASLLATIHRRVLRFVRRRGIALRSEDDGSWADSFAEDAPMLAALSSASVQGRSLFGARPGAPILRVGRDPDAAWVTSRGPRHAHLNGFDLHANRTVRAADRAGLERLVHYLLRPPLAQGRLERMPDGRVAYTMAHPWSDGTRQLVFAPLELLEKLAVLVPRPRVNLLLYHGILAPHARGRAPAVRHARPPETGAAASAAPAPAACAAQPPQPEAVPPAVGTSTQSSPSAGAVNGEASTLAAAAGTTARPPRQRYWAWADPMRRVFDHTINHTPHRGAATASPDHPSVPSAARAGARGRRTACELG